MIMCNNISIISVNYQRLTSEGVLSAAPGAGAGLLSLLLPPPGLEPALTLGHVRHRRHHSHNGGAQGVDITCKYPHVMSATNIF